MGLSSSKQKTSTSQAEQRQQASSGTETPLAPDWLEAAARDYVGRIGGFAAMDPAGFVAPAAPLHEQAWAATSGLGGWRAPLADAAAIAQDAAGRGPNYSGPAGPRRGPSLADAGPSVPVRIAAPQRAEAAGFAERIEAYRSPFARRVVEGALAAHAEEGARAAARLHAQGAQAGALGGSRFGLAEGQLAAAQAAEAGRLAATLEEEAYRHAAGLAQSEAAARQQAGTFNAGEANRMAQAQAALEAGAAQNHAALRTQRDLARFGVEAAAEARAADSDERRALFDAGQADRAAGRELEAARLLGELGASGSGQAREELRLLAWLGDQQRGVAQAQALAPLAQLQAIGELSGMTPYEMLVGRRFEEQGSESRTTTGTSTTKTSPGLFGQLLGAARTAAQFL